MPQGLYSDQYLKALITEKPKLAKEFFTAIAESEYVGEKEIISCIEVPDWVLVKAGVAACKNPNFPMKNFEEFLGNEETLTESYWNLFNYPHLKKEHIKKLSQHSNINVRGLALAHPFGDHDLLLALLKKVIPENDHSCHVITNRICQTVPLNDELFAYLTSVHDFESGSRTIGQALWDNPSLSDLHKAELVLSEITPKGDGNSFWDDHRENLISSVPYFQLFDSSFGYLKAKFDSIPTFSPQVTQFFNSKGHPLSVLLPEESEAEIKVDRYVLDDLNSAGLLNRLFWSELCQRDDFEIYRRNAYRTDDLFISHPILSREFEEADVDNATHLGGVFIFDNQKWLIGNQELPADRAAWELRAYEQSMATIVEDGTYEYLGQTLIAMTFELPELPEKYGFELTEDAEEWMIDAALEFAEPDSFDVSADLNPLFREVLSWSKTPDAKKLVIFEFLLLGLSEEESKLRSDCIHFLGCMALHDSTPKSILEKLAKIKDPLIDEVLSSRN